jgi:hypothetical protein
MDKGAKMTHLLKFDRVKTGDILVSPWGTEVEISVYKDKEFEGTYYGKVFSLDVGGTTCLNSVEIAIDAFEIYFGGWKVKDE